MMYNIDVNMKCFVMVVTNFGKRAPVTPPPCPQCCRYPFFILPGQGDNDKPKETSQSWVVADACRKSFQNAPEMQTKDKDENRE